MMLSPNVGETIDHTRLERLNGVNRGCWEASIEELEVPLPIKPHIINSQLRVLNSNEGYLGAQLLFHDPRIIPKTRVTITKILKIKPSRNIPIAFATEFHITEPPETDTEKGS
jgi:hypothetical protein